MSVTPQLIAALLLIVLVVALIALAALRDNRARAKAIRETAAGFEHTDSLGRLRRRLNSRFQTTSLGHKIGVRLAGATVSWGAADFALAVTAVALLLAALLRPFLGNLGALVVIVAVMASASRWLDHRRRKRVDAFVAQLPDLARILGNAASAGLALRTGVDVVAREMSAPASEEFAEVSRQLALGSSLDDAFEDLHERLPSRELSVLVRTLVIQSRAGGALVSALVNISQTLESRKELRREIKTSVSGAIFGGYTVVAIGVGSVLVMNLITPGALDRLSQTLPGQLVMVVSGFLFFLGYLLMRKITDIEV